MLSYLSLNEVITLLATSAAIVAAVSAYFSYSLSKKIYNEIKSDEVVISGPVHRVGLIEKDHNDPLIRVTLFNKSARKTFITSVDIKNADGSRVPATWSNSISSVGNIENPTGLLGLLDTENLYIRRNDGKEFIQAHIHIKHSFSDQEMVLQFDPYGGWSKVEA